MNNTKTENTFDAEGNILIYAISDWTGSDWMLSNQTQYFYHSDGSEAIDQISQELKANSQKLIKDGKLLILRGDKTYTITGQEVK